jgi:carboxyl-terminal processing protease
MTRYPSHPRRGAAAALALLIPSAQAETNFGQVAMHVAYMLQNHHYSKQDFDDKVSGRCCTTT